MSSQGMLGFVLPVDRVIKLTQKDLLFLACFCKRLIDISLAQSSIILNSPYPLKTRS
jgi:hypothetical protein